MLVSKATVFFFFANCIQLAYVCRILASTGMYEIVACRDGQDALDRLKVMHVKPQLVISDIMMPRLGGFGLLKAMREQPDLSRIPVIFLSARAGEEARTEVRQLLQSIAVRFAD